MIRLKERARRNHNRIDDRCRIMQLNKNLGIALVVLFIVSFVFVGIASATSWVVAEGELYPGTKKLSRTSDGVLHTVYYRSDGQYLQIYHSYSSDNGETWTEEALTSESYNQTYPAIAVDSNDYLHVVWSDSGNIKYRKYTTS